MRSSTDFNTRSAFLRPSQCDRLAAFLQENQIGTARPYKDIAAIAATHYGYTGDCPRAERIASTVLVIPCNYAIKAADIERIANCVNRAWAEVRGRQGAGARSVLGSATKAVENPATGRTA